MNDNVGTSLGEQCVDRRRFAQVVLSFVGSKDDQDGLPLMIIKISVRTES